MAYGLTYESKGSKVKNAVESLAERTLDRLAVAKVRDDQAGLAWYSFPVPALQTVEHDDLVSRRQQLLGHGRAYITGATGNEPLHRFRGVERISAAHITDLQSAPQ
jgi:hypothetical protein